MNVTLKIDDQLCRNARHRAVDAGLSLSGWVAEIIQKELSRPASSRPTLLEALGNEKLSALELHFERTKNLPREVDLS